MKRNNLKIDPASPYYRVCLYRACSKPFMSTNPQQLYHDHKCADDDYNLSRRLKKMKIERRMGEFDEEEPIPIPETSSTPQSGKREPVPAFEINPKQVEKNIEVFSSLSIDKKNGSIYGISFLEDLGVDLRHYTYFFPLCNLKNGFCVMFGNFLTYLVSPLEVLIYFNP